MSHTYGPELRFIAFDIQIDEHWLNVLKMDKVATDLGFEVVPWVRVPTEIAILDAERDKPSEVAVRRGMGNDKVREGVVLRPLEEMTDNNGERVILVKYKGEKFSERATPQKTVSSDKLVVLKAAEAIAEEWVTPMRLDHVLDKLPIEDCSCVDYFGVAKGVCPNCNGAGNKTLSMQDTPRVIAAVIEDIFSEAKDEIVESKEAKTVIGKKDRPIIQETPEHKIGLSCNISYIILSMVKT